MLQRLFSAFPGGLPGISLLLLRAVLGVSLLIQALTYFAQPDNPPSALALGICAAISGGLLLIGFLTPVVGILVAIAAASVALSYLPNPASSVFSSKPALVFAITMLLTIIGAGPGRFSVDARLFGRREIIIPPSDL